eukprot:TRINITY_DN3884_c0_g2_i1.p1 TRINITY_DN3884_c0_g2~~TRINITY_DN3884_c0_g2_i1.p1  ORF type:complete len:125 (-),score=18.88 TRINITY_DN3884_c0_g2_i1:533-907(-)
MFSDTPFSSVGSILVPTHVLTPIDDEVGSGGNEQVPLIPSPNAEVISNEPNARLKSVVWQHFGKIEITEKVNGKDVPKVKVVCKYCKKSLVSRLDDGTSHLHRHFKLCLNKPSTDKSKKTTFKD